MIRFLLILSFLCLATIAQAQKYTRQDTLRGSLLPERSCFDVLHYDLNLRVEIDKKHIVGYNLITYKTIKPFKTLQLDLFENLTIDSVVANFDRKDSKKATQKLDFKREGKAFFVNYSTEQTVNSVNSLAVFYHGNPTIAANPPWDGGFTFSQDKQGRTWVGVSCEGIGASIWYPNKDHLSDEPDSMRIYCEVPTGLTCVANGNLASQTNTKDNYTGFEWKVSYPINNYNVTLNIANYAHFKDVYVSADDKAELNLDYYVLDYNKEKAEKHFQQVKTMLACFEKYFGKYPFWRDGYALVETPYWGMEHQGAIAYGNNYRNLAEGFDFIIIHESGHEYFGNSLSVNDHAEMWIHESFTTYTEAVYMEYTKGYNEAVKYLLKQRKSIANVTPMLGHFDVNYQEWVGSDIYYKGTWMLHSLRGTLDNDELWFSTLKSYVETFKISQVTTQQTIEFFNKKTGKNLTPIFNEYLRYKTPPKLVYSLQYNEKDKTTTLSYKWQSGEADFNMPMKVKANEFETKYKTILPTQKTQTLVFKGEVTAPYFAEELFYFDLIKADKL